MPDERRTRRSFRDQFQNVSPAARASERRRSFMDNVTEDERAGGIGLALAVGLTLYMLLRR